PERQVVMERVPVDRARDPRMPQQRLDLRREHELPAALPVIERLLAEPVARDEEPAPARVPDGEREHAGERLDAALAVLLEEMHDRLGVAPRPESMAARFEPGAELAVVVDLPVEDEPER